MVIDFHVHLFPNDLALKTIPLLAKRSGLTPHSDGTLGDTLLKMSQQGVDKIVQLNIATNPKQMKKVNDFAISCNQNEKIIAFGSIHPEATDFVSELDRLRDAGVLGIKLHPDYQAFFIDAPHMQRIYEEILKRDFILVFHAGLDYGLPEPIHATPGGIVNCLGLFSGEKVVLAHMGGFMMYDEVLEKIVGRDVYLDTSFATGYANRITLHKMLKAHKPDKLLFATDFPWGDFQQEMQAIQGLSIEDELKEKIFYKNAVKLLGI